MSGPGQLPVEDHAAFLERVRRSGISVDREGRFWHEGEIIQHSGLRQALFRWLDRLPPPEDRYVLRLDAQRFAYLDVQDTPLVATSLRWDGPRALLGLTDGQEVALDPAELDIDEAGTLRCQVRANGVEARLATSAASALAERIEASDAGPVLKLGAERHPIRRRARR